MSRQAEPQQPIHVAHVLLAMDIGGMEKGVLALLAGLDKTRFRQSLICLADIHPELLPHVEASGADVHTLKKAPFRRDEAVLWRLFRLLKTLRPDIVHSRNYPAGAPISCRVWPPASAGGGGSPGISRIISWRWVKS